MQCLSTPGSACSAPLRQEGWMVWAVGFLASVLALLLASLTITGALKWTQLPSILRRWLT